MKIRIRNKEGNKEKCQGQDKIRGRKQRES
jgi:hypothetical protein